MTQAAAATHDEPQARSAHGSWRAALAGFLAVAVMLGVAELLAAIVPGARSLVIAVADEVIDRSPGWLERAVIQRLGTHDKPFLIANVLVASALLGALLGVLAARRFVFGAVGIAFMAAVGTAACSATRRSRHGAALGRAGRRGGRHRRALAAAARGAGELGDAQSGRRRDGRPAALPRRRRGRGARGRSRRSGRPVARGERSCRRDPADDRPAATREERAAGAGRRAAPDRRAHARSSRRTTASTGSTPRSLVPQVDPDTWSLKVKGMVDQPLQLTLRRAPRDAADRGRRDAVVRLERGRRRPRRQRALAGRAAARPARPGRRAERRHPDRRPVRRRLHGRVPDRARDRGRDGAGRRRDERRAAAGGARLPGAAGRARPLRLRVGDQVAVEIELSTLDEFDGYWIPRGWSKEGPIKTQSRIDVPAEPTIDAAGRRSPASRGRRRAASSASRCRSTTASGRTRRWATRSATTRGGSG